MTYEERKQRRLKKRKRRNMIIIIISTLFLARTAYGIIINNPKTILPIDEEYRAIIMAQSVMIKDEKVYDIDGNIGLNSKIEEGRKVSKGYEIGKANIAGDIGSLNEELDEINRAIDLLNDKNQGAEIFQRDRESLESTQDSLISEIQSKINEKDYSGVEELKDKILFNDEKLGNVSMEDTLLGKSLEGLNARKNTIIDQINNNSVNYYSQEAGLISFEIDDYEKLYIPKEFENYTYDKLKIPEEDHSEEALEEENKSLNQYKIIDNFNWYLAIKIDNMKAMQSYEVNDIISLKVADVDRELVGNIVAINESNKKAVYIAKFNSHLHDYYNLRFPTVEIISNRRDAFSIPTKAIIDKDGQKGVYIKEFNGIVRFRPIEIIGEIDNHTFISKGDENSHIDVKSETQVRTVSLYDEILISPWTYNEGDILN